MCRVVRRGRVGLDFSLFGLFRSLCRNNLFGLGVGVGRDLRF